MVPEVLPIRPPPTSVSEPEPLIVTPSVPVRFSVLNDLAEVTVVCVPVGETLRAPLEPSAPRSPRV